MKQLFISFVTAGLITFSLFGYVTTYANEYNSNDLVNPRVAEYYYKYKETSYKNIYGTAQAVTPQVTGPASVSYGQSKSVSATFSVSLGSSQKSTIVNTIGSSVGLAASSNENFGMTFTIPDNKTMRVYFEPLFRESTGNLEKWKFSTISIEEKLISTEKVTSKLPQKVRKIC